MEIKRIFFIVILLYTASSCAVWKKTLSPNGGVNMAVSNVITDFVNTSRLFKADTVFTVSIIDREDHYIIGIGKAGNKVYPYFENVVGSKDDLFPTKYEIREGKLFYWNDPEQPIAQEIIDVLSQFNHIDLDWRDREYNIPLDIKDGDPQMQYLAPLAINDGIKSMVYYIHKNDFTNYKKEKGSRLRLSWWGFIRMKVLNIKNY